MIIIITKEELPSVEYSVKVSLQRLEDYKEKHEGGLITAIKNDTDNTMTNRMKLTRKQNGKKNNSFVVFND